MMPSATATSAIAVPRRTRTMVLTSPYDTTRALGRHRPRGRGVLRTPRRRRWPHRGPAAHPPRALAGASRDGDVFGSDRDHGAGGSRRIRVPRSGGRRLCSTRRASGCRRRLRRNVAAAADHESERHLRVRRPHHGDRGLAPRLVTTSTIVYGIVLGLAAGVLSGLFGVGGGILFVPTLVALGLGQIEAQATSLAAILPTVAAGTWRQASYGNVRW